MKYRLSANVYAPLFNPLPATAGELLVYVQSLNAQRLKESAHGYDFRTPRPPSFRWFYFFCKTVPILFFTGATPMTDISIILPVYNNEKDLPTCLDGILSQTLTSFELICIDDDSTDKTPEILKDYAQKDKRITVIKQKHRGAGPARNLGLKHAKGKYIAFIDGDDFYPENTTLEKLFTAAIKNKCDICGGSLVYYGKAGAVIPAETDYTFADEGFCNYDFYQFDYGYYRFLYRLDFIKKNNLYFPDYLRGQDPPFFVNAMIAAGRFWHIPDVCYCYRLHEEKTRKPFSEKQICGTLCSIRDILQTSSRHNLAKLHYIQAERLNNLQKRLKPWFNNSQICRLTGETASFINLSLINKINPDFKTEEFIGFLASACKISVIVPVYNVAPYLEKCLNSIIGQTVKETEIICVDDGSTDDSRKILEQYKQKDNRIKVIHQNNYGLSAARNAGLKEASAPYIAFIDSDDWIDSRYLELLLLALLTTDADCAVCSSSNISEQPELFLRTRKHDAWTAKRRHQGLVCNKSIDVDYIIPNAWAKIYKKSLIDQYSLVFPEGLINEDEAWHWYYTNLSKNTVCLSDTLYKRLIRANSIMGQKDVSPKITDILTIYLHIYRFLRKYGFWQLRKKEFYDRCQGFINNIIKNVPPELYRHAADKIASFIIKTKTPADKSVYKFIRQYASPIKKLILHKKKTDKKIKKIWKYSIKFAAAYLLFPFCIYKIYKKL